MLKIVIDEEVPNEEGAIDLLNRILLAIQDGFTQGHKPRWRLEGESEDEESIDETE